MTDLKPDPRNARKHTDGNKKLIKQSLQEVGAFRSIAVDGDDIIRAGNGVFEQAQELGLKVRVIEAEPDELIAVKRKDLTGEKAERAAIFDNRTQEVSEWDQDVLKIIERETPEVLEGIYSAGQWMDQAIAESKAKANQENDDDREISREQRSEDLQEKYQVKPGDLFQLGDHRLICGDATDPDSYKRLMDGQPADLVFTDPPYGVDAEAKFDFISKLEAARGQVRDEIRRKVKNDNIDVHSLETIITQAFKNIVAYTRDQAGFYIWHATDTRRLFERALDLAGLEEKQYITWVKGHFVIGYSDYQYISEYCFYCQKIGSQANYYGDRSQTTAWRIAINSGKEIAASLANGIIVSDGAGDQLFISPKMPKNSKVRKFVLAGGSVSIDSGSASHIWEVSHENANESFHPTQKPVELAINAIRNSSKVGDIILDPFAGSGSTMIAAERTGRKARIMVDPVYCAAAIHRWNTITGQDPERL